MVRWPPKDGQPRLTVKQSLVVGNDLFAGRRRTDGPGQPLRKCISTASLAVLLCGLTFEVTGGRKWAKPACGRPVD